jgi:hypothetical protein
MQFGIGLPNLSYVDPTETLMRLAHAAQEPLRRHLGE